jgi:hypothetical protein
MSIEAMKQALEALESVYGKGKKCNAAITILRKTIEQQTADKPKWYHGVDVNGCNRFYHHDEVRPAEFNTPLYTHPPKREWVGLTDDEMLMIYGQQHEGKKYSLGRMVEQALKEKNNVS